MRRTYRRREGCQPPDDAHLGGKGSFARAAAAASLAMRSSIRTPSTPSSNAVARPRTPVGTLARACLSQTAQTRRLGSRADPVAGPMPKCSPWPPPSSACVRANGVDGLGPLGSGLPSPGAPSADGARRPRSRPPGASAHSRHTMSGAGFTEKGSGSCRSEPATCGRRSRRGGRSRPAPADLRRVHGAAPPPAPTGHATQGKCLRPSGSDRHSSRSASPPRGAPAGSRA